MKTPAWKHIPFLAPIETLLKKVENILNFSTAALIIFLMFFATAEVFSRYFFNFPIPGHVEIVELIMAGVVFFGISYTERVRGHVGMELFVTYVLKGRWYHLFQALVTALSLLVFVFITIYSFKAALFSFKIGDTTAYLYWPTWPSKVAIPVGAFFLCCRFSIEIIQHISQVVTGEELRDLD